MTTLHSRPPLAAAEGRDGLFSLARRRRLRRAVPAGLAGTVLMLVSFVGFLAAEPRPVGVAAVVLARPVVAGHPLTAADLKVVHVQAPGLAVIPASRLAGLPGRALAESLPAGALLSPAELAGPAGPQPGQAIVGAALKPGSYPAGLSTGAKVAVFAGAGQPVTDATVFELSASPDGSAVEISLLVAAPEAPALDAAAAAGTLSVVWVAP